MLSSNSNTAADKLSDGLYKESVLALLQLNLSKEKCICPIGLMLLNFHRQFEQCESVSVSGLVETSEVSAVASLQKPARKSSCWNSCDDACNHIILQGAEMFSNTLFSFPQRRCSSYISLRNDTQPHTSVW